MQKLNKLIKILFTFLLCIVIINSQAQTGLNFQGVARTSNNIILASQPISLRLSILQGSSTGIAEYVETRRVTTNAQGLFTAVIGDTGSISTLGNFSTINWKNTPKFLKIEMDAAAGTNFITMGTTQFQYVAYAQFAKSVDAENISGVVPVARGGTGTNSLSAFKTVMALDKVNNTADTDKPISAKTQTALDLKLNAEDTNKYAKQIWIDSALLTKINNTDTIKYVKKTYADSSLVTKLKITDTAAMLTNRIGKDTLSLSNRINLKANLADFNNINTTLSSKLNLADTIKYTKQTYTDSSLLTKLRITDTAAMLSNRIGKDTLNLSARINAKVNTSDMSSELALKANTTDVTISLALKENSSNKSSATDLGGTSPSDLLYPTQKAVKAYVTANASGGGVADGGISTIKIADAAVTDTKINTVSGSKVIGNITGNAASATIAGNITATTNTTLTTLSSLTNVGTLANLTVTNPINGSITGNAVTATTATIAGTASTATKLATAKNINGVAFDGSGDITVTADAGTLAGTTLNSTVTESSLTSLGILVNATVNGKVIVGASEEASASAVLEASSTTQGFLPPRMTVSERNNINSPVAGLMIWNSTLNRLDIYDGSFWVTTNGIISVGQSYQGGIIAYILVSGDPGYDASTPHGLIAATSDQTSEAYNTGIQWYNGVNTSTGATGKAIGTGLSNTNAIIASQGPISTDYAAGLARAYTGGGYTDWYLPSKDELNKLYLNKTAIGGFNGFFYWSSSENAANSTWYQEFYSGNQSYNYKSISAWKVRAIRAF